MSKVVILQRVVPSYRMPVYRRLWRELGWPVAYGRNLSTEGMQMEREAPFLRGYDFRTTRSSVIRVPVSEIIRDLKPDVIIAEGALRLTSTWELLARRKLMGGPKVFFWSIGYNPAKAKDPAAPGSGQWIYPAVYKYADGCLTYGRDGRAFLLPRLGGKPVFVAHNSIDMDFIRHVRDKTPALPRRGFPELVSVSRLTAGKEYVRLVDAFHIILKSFPDAHLTIIGDGPERDTIMRAAGGELDKHIHLTGASYDEAEVAGHMNRADAFVMTGRVGLAINHALGYNLPVISYQRTGLGPFHGSEITHLQPGVTGYEVCGYDANTFAEEVVLRFRETPDLRAKHKPLIEDYVARNLSIDFMVQGFKAINEHLRKSEGLPAAQYAN